MVITPVKETSFARQLMETIEERIARTPIAELVAKFGPLPLDPYPYQWAAYGPWRNACASTPAR